MNIDVQLAKYREACARADDAIDAYRDATRSQGETIAVQRQIIQMLHQQIGQLERQIEELKAGL